MVNFIWLFLLLVGIVMAAFCGRIEAVSAAIWQVAEQGIALTLEIAGIMMLWMGLLRLAEKSGFTNFLARLTRPVVGLLFPDLAKDSPALGAIVMNISANLLGLGNAATPFGLKAMDDLQKLNKRPEEASNSMITFLVLNTSAITLIPATVIALRAKSGSLFPEEIVGITIFSGLIGTVVGLLAHFLFCRFRRWR